MSSTTVIRPPVPVPTGISRHQGGKKSDETYAASAPETLTITNSDSALFTVAPVPSEHQVPPGTHHPHPVSTGYRGLTSTIIIKKQKYIGTLLSSHTTSPRHNINHTMVVNPLTGYFRQGLFSSRLLASLRGAVGRADSHKVTHHAAPTQLPRSEQIKPTPTITRKRAL